MIQGILFPKDESSYMKAEDVHRYLKLFGKPLPLAQYTIGDCPNHFYKCSQLSNKLGFEMFRRMECEVTQYIVLEEKKKEIINQIAQ
jgi:hypothetical protein